MTNRSAACRSILQGETGHISAMHYRFVRQDGRTFLIGLGGSTSISELKPDGSLKPLAMVGSTHRYCFACDWKPPQAIIDAFEKTYPTKKGKVADKGPGFLWIDRNGDGLMQADEIQFSTAADNFAGGYWGHDSADLTIRLPATIKNKRVLVTLSPKGFNSCGAPDYGDLNAACAAGVSIDLPYNEVETTTDRFGNLICNSDPQMKAFAPDGKLLWTYPNRWSNVHGSHNAPLPQTGVMQGCLFFLGTAPLDEKSDVFVINGNHGRFFLLTSDGLYLDEMFRDVRMGGTLDAQMIGGECFGGFFGRSDKDGNYYLQSGHTDYRIFRIDGLKEAKRGGGSVTVSAQQSIAAQRRASRKLVAGQTPRQCAIRAVAAAPAMDAKDDGWPKEPTVSWDRSGKFPVAVRAAYDQSNLYLCYTVSDDSPWTNGGKDWTLLFKTGDSVDWQIGTDASAKPNRTGPAVGDARLLIAPFEGATWPCCIGTAWPGRSRIR